MSESVSEQKTRSEQKKLQKEEKKLDRQQRKAEKAEGQEQKQKRKEEKLKGKTLKRRVFPIWLRIVVVATLCFLALILGLMMGYGVIGDGKAADVLEFDTWKHIKNIVTGNPD
ncbi:DNA-directed RNA polymerase subunit beta [Radiobacillus kanasensis]|uniref:DNA-directed RNA polymerase subunit beta n=1 Tax=Radiobacillus kanasensis TaxID=2844358 RepID=UPI001E6575D4|nr:DNA-directed RNA polymerase subunit beta [Radiobacillus kanasensis]UFT98903.1 DNA-directed RNA polymerase subunit beta [Radiobacillus kanasensis]